MRMMRRLERQVKLGSWLRIYAECHWHVPSRSKTSTCHYDVIDIFLLPPTLRAQQWRRRQDGHFLHNHCIPFPYTMIISFIPLYCCALYICLFIKASHQEEPVDQTCHAQTCSNDVPALRVPDDCGVVMAPSDLSGWGLFAVKPFDKNEVPLHGDVVIAISDAHPTYASGMKLMIHDYLWDSHEVGQQYEGQKVMSVLPGVGMLANGHAQRFSLLAEREPNVGDAGVTRDTNPTAGSFTLHYNLSFYLQRPVSVGEELLVTYGELWFRERNIAVDDDPPPLKTYDWLRDNGYCVDNLKPGTTANLGRGAFSTRFLPQGSIVAPVPVLPLTRNSLKMIRQRQSGELLETQQLLLNYCFGHANSSLLLYPYSPMVNLINHSSETPNVKLQWATSQATLDLLSVQDLVQQDESPGLLLELVALRDISEGEEAVMDYGEEWQQAWNTHVQEWKPATGHYVPSFNVSLDILRTEKELRQDSYPDNVFTSCFYRYRASEHVSSEQVTMDQWKESKNTMELRNLRPCAILERMGVDANGKEQLYTVQLRNRFGLKDDERLSKGRIHVMTHVPRRAIRLSDKLYTTDPHLEDAFRHEIGLLSFPAQWIDLA